MQISKVSLEVASQLSSCSTFGLHKFFQKSKPGEIFDFCHYSFYYSCPEFGLQWKNGMVMQFHQVYTCCSKCQAQPDRNFAGIGSMCLCMNDSRKASLLCDECAEGFNVYGEVKRFVQMKLFTS